MVDLVKMKALIWSGEELGAKFEEVDIPADMVEKANTYREQLIDAIIDQASAGAGRAALCPCYLFTCRRAVLRCSWRCVTTVLFLRSFVLVLGATSHWQSS